MKMKLFTSVAFAALLVPGAAFAQSTGSTTVDDGPDIVVTGTVTKSVGGVQVPDTPKSRTVLDQELIARRSPGQSILDTVNLVPGVNYTNNDAFGSSGGNLNIRGFDGNRISLTFDGLPLNDTGNYAIFGNQQLDPELIEQVNVNLGATDVDSPTASASGGTVNYRSRTPRDKFGGLLVGSLGSNDYRRAFGLIDTGVFTSFGTKAYFSASEQAYEGFKGSAKLLKTQYNAKIYQPLWHTGDFIAVSGNYNRNRNNNYLTNTIANTFLYPTSDYSSFCTRPIPGPGAQVDSTACTSQTPSAALNGNATGYYNLFFNPSNTGNVRLQSKFTLTNTLLFTLDGGYQYTLADGGTQSTVLSERSPLLIGTAGAFTGVDLNGDGDTLDTVRVINPSITNTRRYTALASLIWTPIRGQTIRASYTFDRGKHRQTGEYGFVTQAGDPESVFGGRNGRPVLDALGNVVERRNRLSYATLNQISGEYRGKFFGDQLGITLGLRVPFFKRNLNQYCYTNFTTATITVATGTTVTPSNPYCTSFGSTLSAGFTAPFKTTYSYSKPLPNVGVSFRFGDHGSIYASYAKGYSVPRTDNLYNFAAGSRNLIPETTDAFDLGLRYTSSKIQAQLAFWRIVYQNRIVQSFDRDTNTSIDTNVGVVHSRGIDANVSYRPIKEITLYAFGSYKDTDIGDTTIATSATTSFNLLGRELVDSAKWLYGGRAQGALGPVSAGVEVKHVSSRYVDYVNSTSAPAYTITNADVRLSLTQLGLPLRETYFQFNVINLTDELYISSIPNTVVTGGATGAFVNRGAPRTFLGSLHVGF